MVTVVTISFPKGKFCPSGILGAASRTETAFQQRPRDSKSSKLSTKEEKKSGRLLGPNLEGLRPSPPQIRRLLGHSAFEQGDLVQVHHGDVPDDLG